MTQATTALTRAGPLMCANAWRAELLSEEQRLVACRNEDQKMACRPSGFFTVA